MVLLQPEEEFLDLSWINGYNCINKITIILFFIYIFLVIYYILKKILHNFFYVKYVN